jgi:3-oxoacyl-[acyl-carrier protein] reductase
MYNFNHKTVIITGGGKGIGKGTAIMFAQSGANVAIFDIDIEAANEVAAYLNKQNYRAKSYQVDTCKKEQVINAVQEVKNDFSSIDILINNAGITRDSSLKKMTDEQWQQVIDVNLTGVFNCTKAVFPYMEQQGSGRIINAASIVAHYGNFGQTNYVATKAGVIGMTKVWAREFGRKGITVNAIAPGFINTEMVQTIPETYLDELKSRTPVNRLGEVEDIAHAYLFLASDQASFITGTTLCVDGGLVL